MIRRTAKDQQNAHQRLNAKRAFSSEDAFFFLPGLSARERDELEAELGGFLLHVFDLLLFILLFVFGYVYLFEFHFVL